MHSLLKENNFSGGMLYIKEISLNIILTLRIKVLPALKKIKKDVFIVFVKSKLSIWLPHALQICLGAVTLQKYQDSILRITHGTAFKMERNIYVAIN